MRWLLLAPALLAGCASSEPLRTADGSEGHLINCPGLVASWDDCHAKAVQLCGQKGYREVDRVKDGDLVSTIPGLVSTAGSAKIRWVKVRCLR